MTTFDPETATRQQLIAEVYRLQSIEQDVTGARDLRAVEMKNRLGLTATEARVLWALRSGKVVAHEVLYAAQSAGRDDVEPTKLLHTYIYKIRQKIEPRGMAIENVFGCGYRLIGHEVLATVLERAE